MAFAGAVSKWVKRELREEDSSRRIDSNGDAALQAYSAELARARGDETAVTDPDRTKALHEVWKNVESTHGNHAEVFKKALAYIGQADRINQEPQPVGALSKHEEAFADFRRLVAHAEENAPQMLPFDAARDASRSL